MKTLGKIIALAFVLFHSACESDDPPPYVSCPDPKWKPVTISANLTPEVRDYGDRTVYFSWSGSATSNLEDKVNLALSHEAYNFDDNEPFDIQDGYFSLWSDDHQHTLNGTYTGRGYETNGQFVMEGVITVQSGTGKFAYENASLSFSIGRIMPFSDPATESEILIRGKLEVPVNVPEL